MQGHLRRGPQHRRRPVLAAIRTDTILGERSIAVSPAGSGKSTTIPLSRTTTPYTLNGVLQDLGRNANDLNRPQFEQALNVFTQALHDATRRCVVPWTG